MEFSQRDDATPAFKWGVFVPAQNGWKARGFFRTQSAAKQTALASGYDVFLIARRFTVQEARASRGAQS